MTVTLDQARDAKRKAAAVARSFIPVVGVGLTRSGDSWAIKVNLESSPHLDLPKSVDGVPILYEVTGIPRKLA